MWVALRHHLLSTLGTGRAPVTDLGTSRRADGSEHSLTARPSEGGMEPGCCPCHLMVNGISVSSAKVGKSVTRITYSCDNDNTPVIGGFGPTQLRYMRNAPPPQGRSSSSLAAQGLPL